MVNEILSLLVEDVLHLLPELVDVDQLHGLLIRHHGHVTPLSFQFPTNCKKPQILNFNECSKAKRHSYGLPSTYPYNFTL